MTRAHVLVLMVLCGLLAPRPVWSQEVLQSIGWPELEAARRLAPGAVVDPSAAGGPSLRIAHGEPAPATFELVVIENPPIRAARYAVRGRVRYDGVAGGSYLEMWNHLPEGAFFSRTLGDRGPTGRLGGSSGWREFLLPFANREGGAPPHRLVVNLVLTGSGTVEVSPLELVQFTGGDATEAGAWWSAQQAGLLGGILGSALGTLGAVLGWLGSAGRARGFVLGSLKAMAGVGLGFLVLGAWAYAIGQQYVVYYPLLLIGAVCTPLGVWLPKSLARRYEDQELQRMRALDA